MTQTILAFLLGLIIGGTVAYVLLKQKLKDSKTVAEEIYRAAEVERKREVDAVVENIKSVFGSLSLDALAKSTEQLMALAQSTLSSERQAGSKDLESKKVLIDQQLGTMAAELQKVSQLVNELERDRIHKFGQLESQLKSHSEQTQVLLQTTQSLREALSSSKARGQWGERMAEDVLRIAGFVENVNYYKQKLLTATGERPDFTFPLPKSLVLNMDVKFPLDNYLRYLEAVSDGDKAGYLGMFLKDVRSRVKELTVRGYINPEMNTVDYVLLFIPNEQVYGFIHEHDRVLLDDALRNKVIFCSPLTLFAILAVIRQAIDNFSLENTSREILSLYGSFAKQWEEFMKRFEKLGKSLETAQIEYDAIVDTRRRKLESVLGKIENLRTEKGLTEIPPDIPRDLDQEELSQKLQ